MSSSKLLIETYNLLEEKLFQIDFNKLLEGFKPFSFALYNKDFVYSKHQKFIKTDAFIGNTTIAYQNEQIAIWNLEKSMDIDILCSKIIHEMVHAHQVLNNEKRFPNEIKAIFNFNYENDYLNRKYLENHFLNKAIKEENHADFFAFLDIRNQRQQKYQSMTTYEFQVEVIEGLASFVELMVLKQINMPLYLKTLEKLLEKLKNPNDLLPIRILSYDVGALLLLAMVMFNYKIDFSMNNQKTYAHQLLEMVHFKSKDHTYKDMTSDLIDTYDKKMDAYVDSAKTNTKEVMEGPFELEGFNVYDAMYKAPYLYTTHFVMVKICDSTKVFYGNFILDVNQDMMVKKIYKL